MNPNPNDKCTFHSRSRQGRYRKQCCPVEGNSNVVRYEDGHMSTAVSVRDLDTVFFEAPFLPGERLARFTSLIYFYAENKIKADGRCSCQDLVIKTRCSHNMLNIFNKNTTLNSKDQLKHNVSVNASPQRERSLQLVVK